MTFHPNPSVIPHPLTSSITHQVMYGQLTLAFMGVLVDASGMAQAGGPVAPPCVALFNGVNWLVATLFLSFSMLPLFFVTWERCVAPA